MKRLISLLAFILVVSAITLVILLNQSSPKSPDELGYLEDYSTDQAFFTAKEAYEVIYPAIQMWNSDAIITTIHGMSLHGREDKFTALDGRMNSWRFRACSNQAKKWVHTQLIRGSVGIGVQRNPWGTINESCRAIPLEKLVDTDIITNTARSRVNDLQPREIYLGGCDPMTSSELLCWNVIFDIPDAQPVDIRLDVYSGEIMNIFSGPFDRDNLGKDWSLD